MAQALQSHRSSRKPANKAYITNSIAVANAGKA